MSHSPNLFCPTYLGYSNKTTFLFLEEYSPSVMEFSDGIQNNQRKENYTVRVFLHFHSPNKGSSFKSGRRLIPRLGF